MAITVVVFTELKEKTGAGQHVFDFMESETAEALFSRFVEAFKLNASNEHIRIAVNESFVEWSTVINDCDEVAFIPPISGG